MYTNTMVILMICWVLGFIAWTEVNAQNFPDEFHVSDLSDLPVVHPQFRKWATPSTGMEARYNPPIMLWPLSEEVRSGYEVRLSRDSSFTSMVYAESQIPYAIYSPYRTLENGEWYWQYRANGEDWSAIQNFHITEQSARWDVPSPERLKSQIPTEHPRVLVNKGNDLDAYRKNLKPGRDVEHIIRQANQNLNRPIPDEELNSKNPGENDRDRLKKLRKDASKVLGNSALTVVESLSRAYVLTGGEQYASTTIEWAMAVSKWDPDGVSSLNDFGDSRCMLAMALAYDTFHDRLSASEKSQLLEAIQARASRFYNDWINEIEAKVLSNHVWQHVFHYFFQTALATYGDLPEAERWLEYLYELFLARAPALGRDDGAWVNGNSYFTMNMAVLLDVPLTIQDLTGFDIIKYKDWFQNNPYYLWYSMPPHSASDGFGDNSKGFGHPNVAYVAYADALGKITGNPYAMKYAASALEGTDLEVSDDHSLRWIRLKYLSEREIEDTPKAAKLPNARLFPDAGLVYMNSDISRTANNLMLAMRSSPFGSYGHMLADQNAFNILYGGKPIFYHSGHKISMNDPHRQKWYKHTRSHNGILVDGEGQPYSTEAYGWIPRFVQGETLSYAMGDASQAYHSVEHGGKTDHGVERFHRHLLMLDSTMILLYDDLEADHPAEWSWVLHSPLDHVEQTGDGRFTFESGKVKSTVEVITSEDMGWDISDNYDTPAENWRGEKDRDGTFVELADDDWHVKGVSKAKEKFRILAIIQVGKAGENFSVVYHADGQIHCGGWTIDAEMDANAPASISVLKNDGTAAFTSGRDPVRVANKTYGGHPGANATLVEWVDGEAVVQESRVLMSEGIQEAWKSMKDEDSKIQTKQ